MSDSARTIPTGFQPALRPAPRRWLSDERLAKLAARGDEEAFELIFERVHQELYRYCRGILGNADDAQDALQNTMAAALRSLPGETRSIALRPWLYRVAHNEAISIARRRADSPLMHEVHWDVHPGADLEMEDRDRLRQLMADLRSLSERQRGALVLREMSGLGYDDIAKVLETTEGAARQIVYEAREAMRESSRGRDMDCEVVREAISARDGRVLRGRALRAHIRTCEPCRDFRAGISQRRIDLQALCPPLPAAAAAGLLASLLGKAAGSGGGLGAAAGSGGLAGGTAIGTSTLAKGGALIAAAVVGAGAADLTGTVDLPLLGGGGSGGGVLETQPASAPAGEGHRSDGAPRPYGSGPSGRASAGAADAGAANARGRGRGQGQGGNGDGGRAHTRGPEQSAVASGAAAQSNGQGVPGGSDGTTAPPEHAVGTGPPETAGTGEGNAGGSSALTPGVSVAPPRSENGALNNNAGVGAPPEQANGSGNPHAD